MLEKDQAKMLADVFEKSGIAFTVFGVGGGVFDSRLSLDTTITSITVGITLIMLGIFLIRSSHKW